MFAFLAPLGGLLLTLTGSLVGRVLLAMGIAYVTFKGSDITIAFLLTNIKSSIGGMPAEVVSFLAYLWVDKAIGMLFAAFTVAMSFKLAGSAGVTKMVTKGAP